MRPASIKQVSRTARTERERRERRRGEREKGEGVRVCMTGEGRGEEKRGGERRGRFNFTQLIIYAYSAFSSFL